MSRFGWTPDIPDARDHLYSAPRVQVIALPETVDLRVGCPPIEDQGSLGSCVGHAVTSVFEFNLIKQGAPLTHLSRLFVYYNARKMEGTIKSDAGAMIRDAIKSVVKDGICPEALWPYSSADPGPFQKKPSSKCYSKAKKFQALTYARVPRNLMQMKGCLASGFPFVFGLSVYDSFELSAAKGAMAMPDFSKENMLGGHAVMAVGYDDKEQRFIVRNSWGVEFGTKGYFTMPYAILQDENLSDDLWTLRSVEIGK